MEIVIFLDFIFWIFLFVLTNSASCLEFMWTQGQSADAAEELQKINFYNGGERDKTNKTLSLSLCLGGLKLINFPDAN